MSRIVFESERPIAQADPGRADVACFIGLVRCNAGAVLPAAVQDWLQAQGWTNGPYARPLSPIADLPIPIETYPAFTALLIQADRPKVTEPTMSRQPSARFSRRAVSAAM